ncbi:MAG: hypothetical protein ACHQJ4_01045 [Ignavibacteria bacterium]
MKKLNFTALFIFVFLSVDIPSSGEQIKVTGKLFQEDEITFSYKYLNDTTQQGGWNYGAEFYLTNTTEQKQRVTWSFSGTENATMKSDGGITDIGPHKTVWIATFTALDISKPWDSGKLHYEWDTIK